MRIYSHDTNPYMHHLALSANKDPLSLKDWRCLHIACVEASSHAWWEELLANLKASHPETECDAVLCTDNDVLLIGREAKAFELHELAEEIAKATLHHYGRQGDIVTYSLMHDWQQIRAMLMSKASADAPIQLPERLYDFGDVSSLKDVFEEARKLRRARAPLYVMVVEDDPLTRRIVANSFKEDYALITAGTAQEAVASYLMHAPDIVFLDIGLPDTSGFDALRQIIASDPEAYVVMFSGNSYLENVMDALGSGAAGFVAKPFKKELMKHYITSSALHHAKQAS